MPHAHIYAIQARVRDASTQYTQTDEIWTYVIRDNIRRWSQCVMQKRSMYSTTRKNPLASIRPSRHTPWNFIETCDRGERLTILSSTCGSIVKFSTAKQPEIGPTGAIHSRAQESSISR